LPPSVPESAANCRPPLSLPGVDAGSRDRAASAINHWNTTWGFPGINPGTKYAFFPPFGLAGVQDYVNAGYSQQDARDCVNAGQRQDFKYPLALP
jgi:hypothetical protein